MAAFYFELFHISIIALECKAATDPGKAWKIGGKSDVACIAQYCDN
jgi:hypothetical protein